MNPTVSDRLVNTLAASLLGLSVLVLLLAISGGFHLRPAGVDQYVDYKAYFDKHNWWPFPIFAVLMWFLVRTSWNGFLVAWQSSSNVLRHKDGSAASDGEITAIVRDMASFRKVLISAALVSSAFYNVLDVRSLWVIYTTSSSEEQIYTAVNEEPDWFTYFVFVADAQSDYSRTRLAISADTLDDVVLPQQRPFKPTGLQLAMTVLSYSQQFLLVGMAFLVLYQLLAHMLFFAFLNKLKSANSAAIALWLDHKDKFNEFGLRSFNTALNKTYWWIAACLPMALVSKAEQTQLSALQFVGNVLVACIPMAPLFLTIIARQYWTESCYERAENDQPDGPNTFQKQRVWPLTINNLHGAGIGVALVLTGLLIGFDVLGLARQLIAG